jgi:hypothetical protein|tara:strand:+ start:217 stop:336 length:120 start_codon:yes stop_codon:yes gene_type:complete
MTQVLKQLHQQVVEMVVTTLVVVDQETLEDLVVEDLEVD